MEYTVTQLGKELDESKYTFNETTKTFSTLENNLILDFSNISGITFKTGSYCIFNTYDDCAFDTSFNCIFKTGDNCTFNTSSSCTFDTSFDCTFDTGADCIFKTGSNCGFKTGPDCAFYTSSNCTFNTGERCVVVRRDVYEVIELVKGEKIELNGYAVKGFTIIKKEKEIKEYTMKELEEKLGETIKIIK